MSTPAAGDLSAALAARLPDLEAAACLALATQARRRTLGKGESVLEAGQSWNDAIWVERGALRLFYLDAEGAEWNKNFFLDDAFLWPVTPWLRTTPAGFFIAALEPVTVWLLPSDTLAQAAESLPSWTAWQLHVLALLLQDKMQREQRFLQCTGRERYEALLQEHPAWPGRIALRHLASYLGMTDVSLSRLRAEMGLIRG